MTIEGSGSRGPVFKWEFTPGNVVTWAVGLFAAAAATAVLMYRVSSLEAFDRRLEVRIEEVYANARRDRETLVELRADIRIIRTLLEQQQQASRPVVRN